MTPSISSQITRAAARGLVAAMAMSGLRRVTTGLGWLEKVPPEEVLTQRAPTLVHPLLRDHQRVAVELAHWAYGTGGGMAFGALPDGMRRSRAVGPIYGLLIWLVFELAIGPALGVARAERRSLVSRAMLVVDHLLYGIVVAGQLAPERARQGGPG